MTNSVARARKVVDTWRAQHAGQPLPMRIRMIDALATRANHYDGKTRQVIDARLAALLNALPSSTAKKPTQRRKSSPAKPKAGPGAALSSLLSHVRAHKVGGNSSTNSVLAMNAFPAMPELDEFRQTWSQVRTRSQLRQSLVKSPENAGPLNSSVLVNRAIHLMRDLSPHYLQHFIAYVDTLSGMEQMQNDGILASQDSPRTSLAKRPTRKPRKR